MKQREKVRVRRDREHIRDANPRGGDSNGFAAATQFNVRAGRKSGVGLPKRWEAM